MNAEKSSSFLARLLKPGLFALGLLTAAGTPALARTVPVKLATLAPKGTSFHLILQEMGQKWRQAPDGGMRLIIYTDGTMGGEADMVKRMRLGQLHAGLLTINGITEIEQSVAGLQNIPMAYRSLDEAQYVREKLAPRYEKLLEEKGFIVLGWFDSGWIHIFSRKPLRTPEDLRGEKVFVVTGSEATVNIARSLNMQPVALEPTDILVSLQTGLVSVVTAPPFYALAGQFYQPAPHMLEINFAPLVGALAISTRSWNMMTPAQREIARKTGTEACAKITEAARREMRESIEAMQKRGLQVQKVDGELEKTWDSFVQSLREKIRGSIVPEDEYDRIIALIEEYRAAHTGRP